MLSDPGWGVVNEERLYILYKFIGVTNKLFNLNVLHALKPESPLR